MGEYYSVKRTDAHLSHAGGPIIGGGSPRVYKGHSYIARVRMASGKYRYIYSTDELAAYKRAQAGEQAALPLLNRTNKKRRTSSKSGGATKSASSGSGGSGGHLSAGALRYQGDNGPENSNATKPTKKKPENSSVKSTKKNLSGIELARAARQKERDDRDRLLRQLLRSNRYRRR